MFYYLYHYNDTNLEMAYLTLSWRVLYLGPRPLAQAVGK